jgi:hypothetical protein
MRQWRQPIRQLALPIGAVALLAAGVAEWQFGLLWRDPVRDRTIFPKTFNSFYLKKRGNNITFNTSGCQNSVMGKAVFELMSRNPKQEAEADVVVGRFVVYLDRAVDGYGNHRAPGATCMTSRRNDLPPYFRFFPDVPPEHTPQYVPRISRKDEPSTPDESCRFFYNSLVFAFQAKYNYHLVGQIPQDKDIPCKKQENNNVYIDQTDWPW